MSGYKLDYYPDMPEQVRMELETTGLMGGDAGHGGWTNVRFSCDSETIIVEVEDRFGNKHRADDLRAVSVRVEGDWETTGMLEALAKVGLQVMRLQNEESVRVIR